MRLSDLRDKKVLTLDGETLGRVHEVHCEGGKVTALMCGLGSFIERWTGKKKGRRIPWETVSRIDANGVTVAPVKTSESRSRQGTPRPSGRQSRR